MKILLVTPIPPHPQAKGAIPLVGYGQLTGLLQRHEVTVVTVFDRLAGEWAAVEALRASGVAVHAVELWQPHGWPRWRRRFELASGWLGGAYPWRTVWFRAPQLQHVLDQLLAKQCFDVVQVEDSAMGIYHYRTAAPVVLTEHEVRRPRAIDWGAWRLAQTPRWLRDEADWLRWPAYQRSVWGRFARVLTFTERDAAILRRLAPSSGGRVRVVPFAIELPPAVDPAQEHPDSLVFVGNFTHYPNVDAALWLGRELMPLLRVRHPDARLTIIGTLPPPEVQALSGPDITVLGDVPRVEPYLEQAAVVLAPIRTGGGMRVKVLQALGMGKAVVTTPRGAEGLTIDGERAPLAIGATANELARLAALLLDNIPLRHALGAQARAFAQAHLSPQAYAMRLEIVYRELQQLPMARA